MAPLFLRPREGPPTAMQHWVYVTLKFNINTWIFAGAVKAPFTRKPSSCMSNIRVLQMGIRSYNIGLSLPAGVLLQEQDGWWTTLKDGLA